MSRPLLNAHRLLIGLVAAMAVVVLIGWTAYARSASSSATRDRERVEAMARMESERDGLLSAKERLQRELSLANAQLASLRNGCLSRKEPKGAISVRARSRARLAKARRKDLPELPAARSQTN